MLPLTDIFHILLSREGVKAFLEEEGRRRTVPVLAKKSYPYDKLYLLEMKNFAQVYWQVLVLECSQYRRAA